VTPQLTGKQNHFLRGLGHHLQPVVMVGKDEITASIIKSTDEALELHELIKIKIQDGCIMDRKDVAGALAHKCNAAVAQILGRTILLFRPSEKKLIELPKNRS